MKTPTLWSSHFSGCLFDRPNIFVLYASCCQIFSFEWMLDSFLWFPLVFQLVFQLGFYTDHQNLGNISLASLCRSKVTFLISNTALIKFFVYKWSQAVKKLSEFCVFTHPWIFLVLHMISAMLFLLPNYWWKGWMITFKHKLKFLHLKTGFWAQIPTQFIIHIISFLWSCMTKYVLHEHFVVLSRMLWISLFLCSQLYQTKHYQSFYFVSNLLHYLALFLKVFFCSPFFLFSFICFLCETLKCFLFSMYIFFSLNKRLELETNSGDNCNCYFPDIS